MLKWARTATALLLTVCICFAGGCSSKSVAQQPKSIPSFSQGSDFVNKTEDGIHIMTVIPVFTGFSAATELNEKIRTISDDGIAEVKQTAKELGDTSVPGSLFFQSYYDSFFDNNILSVWISNENYTGGAHGLQWVRSFNVNIKTGEFYETPGALLKDQVAGTKLITDKIISDIEKQSTSFFPDAVQTVRDRKGDYPFYLNGENLVVYFDLYELTPYAGGIPVFTIPLAGLETKLPLGGYPGRGDVRKNGMDVIFDHKVISNDNGVFLPLKDTGSALGYTVLEENKKYTVDGKPIQPTMIEGTAYMPLQYFTDTLNHFVVYDGNVLRMFTQTAASLEDAASLNSVVSETPLISTTAGSTVAIEEPEKLGYIKSFDEKTGLVTFDPIEWIGKEDTARVKELGLNAEDDFPNGFYIYNPSEQTENLKLSDRVDYYIINGSISEKTDVNGFSKRLKEYQSPYHFTIKNGSVVKIEEQYLP